MPSTESVGIRSHKPPDGNMQQNQSHRARGTQRSIHGEFRQIVEAADEREHTQYGSKFPSRAQSKEGSPSPKNLLPKRKVARLRNKS